VYADRLLSEPIASARSRGAANIFQVLLLALLATCVPVFAHAAGGIAVGLPFVLGLALLIAVGAPAAMPVTIVFAFLFQNAVVALISPLLSGQHDFTLARSYNFLLVVTFWLVISFSHLLGRRRLGEGVATVLRYSYGVLLLIGIYFVIGALHDANGAVIYLRNIATPLMCLQIGLVIGERARPNILAPLVLLALLSLSYGYLELLFQMDFLKLFNGDTYLYLQMQDRIDGGEFVRSMYETGAVYRGLADTITTTPFNYFSELGFKVYRLMGPNFHPISFAYVIAFFAIVLIATRLGAIYLLASLPLLVVIGSKGAVAYLLFTVIAVLAARRYRGNALFAIFVLALAVYAGAALGIALVEKNYHALGFIGGLNQFVANPLGHGLGVGGNLTTEPVDWSKAQQLGHTDTAMESAVGVLLYQMGIAALAVLAFFCWLTWRCWREYRRVGLATLAAASFGILALLVNGILQEEALFAPLALALMTLLAGLGLARESEPVLASKASQPANGRRLSAFAGSARLR
jgi:hypothetical protein